MRMTGAGLVLVAVLCGAVALMAAGGRSEQEVGLWLAVATALVGAGGAVASRNVTRRVGLRGGAARVPEPEVLDEAPADEEVWRRARQRRERAGEEG